MKPTSRPRRMYFVFAAVAAVVAAVLAWRAWADPTSLLLILPATLAFAIVALALLICGIAAERRTRRVT